MIPITVFTCSFNKPKYVTEAMLSVLNQTYKDFEYIVLENSTDGVTKEVVSKIKDPRMTVIHEKINGWRRRKTYPESFLKNKYYPMARGKYILFLADDDLLEPDCLEEHMKDFENNPDHKANYHSLKITYLNKRFPDEIMRAERVFGKTWHNGPICRVDGGTLMHEKSLLDQLKQPYFRGIWSMAHVSDAYFAKHISNLTNLYPINKVLHIKRCTQNSTHYRYK